MIKRPLTTYLFPGRSFINPLRLIQKIYEIGALVYFHCISSMRVKVVIEEKQVIRKIFASEERWFTSKITDFRPIQSKITR